MSTDARSWLRSLGALVTTSMPLAEARERLDILAPVLASEFDGWVFCADSLAFVARRCKFFPTFAELCEHLSAWRKEHKPALQTTALPDNLGLDATDRSWLAFWQRREREGFAPSREPDGRLTRPDVTDWREHTASLIRRMSPKAWAQIERESVDA